MHRLVSWSLQFRFLVLIGAAAIAFFGMTQLRKQNVDILPEFAPLTVEVQAEAVGLAPAEVESLITAPLEEILSGVPWLKSMQSRSIAGLCAISLHFEDGTSLLKARQMVQERLLHTSVLPKVAKPPAMLQPKSDLNRAMQIGLSSDKLSLTEVSLLARWKIKPRLMSVPGVASVAIFGQRERQLQVEVDTEKLNARGVQLQDVIKAAGNALWVSPLTYLRASTPGNGGFIDTPTQRYDIRHVLPISSPEDLARVAFQAADGTTLRLSDVAKVVEGHQPLIGDGIINGAPGLMLVIEKLPGANTIEVTEGVERALEALAPGLPDVKVSPAIYRPATFIQTSVDNISRWLMLAAALAAIAVLVLLRDVRAAVICVVSAALSLLAAWYALTLSGYSTNAMILTGIGVALLAVLDDAVVDVDHFRRTARAGGRASLGNVILHASLEMRRPLLHATLIVALVAFPVLFVQGPTGVLLRPAVIAVVYALIASTIVAHTVTPALCLLFYPASAESAPQAQANWLQERFAQVLSPAVASPMPVLAVAGLATLVGLAALALGPKIMVPALNDRDLVVQWEMKAGTSYPAMSAMLGEASQKVRALAGIREVGAHIGRAIQSDRVSGINKAEIWVGLTADANYRATVDTVRKTLEAYPGIRSEPQSYTTLKVRQALDVKNDTVAVRVFGPRWDELQTKAEEVQKALASVAGVGNPRIAAKVENTNLKIQVDLAKAEKFGVKPGDIRRGVATLMAGIEVGSLYEEQKIFEVIVWGTNAARHDQNGLTNLVIDTPSGGRVRLGEVAEVNEVQSPNMISRIGASRYVDVVADLNGDLGAATANIKASLAAMKFPLEFHTEVVSDATAERGSGVRIAAAAVAAAIGVYLLLQTLVGSWALASMLCLVLLGSVAGGALATMAVGNPISFGSLAGLGAVLLIAARQSVLLVKTAQQLTPGQPGSRMAQAASARALPVLTTAVCAIAVTAPALFMGNVAGLEILRPMAIAMLGGVIASAVLTLVVLPCIRVFYAADRAKDMGRSSGLAAEGSI